MGINVVYVRSKSCTNITESFIFYYDNVTLIECCTKELCGSNLHERILNDLQLHAHMRHYNHKQHIHCEKYYGYDADTYVLVYTDQFENWSVVWFNDGDCIEWLLPLIWIRAKPTFQKAFQAVKRTKYQESVERYTL